MKYSYLQIKEIRKKFGFNQEKFGQMLGVGQRIVQKWEKGDSEISDTCQKLLEMKLKYSIDLNSQIVKEEPEAYNLNKKNSVEDIISDSILSKLQPEINILKENLKEILLKIDKIRK